QTGAQLASLDMLRSNFDGGPSKQCGLIHLHSVLNEPFAPAVPPPRVDLAVDLKGDHVERPGIVEPLFSNWVE
ncbi:TPA: hypothetical protein ACSP3K_004070, partial [Aeromonas veronii]